MKVRCYKIYKGVSNDLINKEVLAMRERLPKRIWIENSEKSLDPEIDYFVFRSYKLA